MRERYDNLDGLRVISCLCIIGMHINANADYGLGSTGEQIVALWTHFVALFLMISGFGMFCGYYERFKSGSIDLNSFYTKRYRKILPFFITLIVIDIAMNRNFAHVVEGITEASLVFGLLPNNQPEVIGVSWTLGVIFLFYMLFPFVVYLCWNKRRIWLTFAASVVLSLFCSLYYFTDKFVIDGFAPRHSFLYCAPWFLAGGIVYIYRDRIQSLIKRIRWAWLALCLCLSVVWCITPHDDNWITMMKNLALFALWLMYAISAKSRVLSNKVVSYLSSISLELYLAQMLVFRVVEKTHCLYLAGHGWVSYLIVWATVVALLIVFIRVWKNIEGKMNARISIE